MNERIRELAEQAKKYALDAMIKITDKEQALKVYSETYDTKFAQLIVAECGNWFNDRLAVNPDYGIEHRIERNRAVVGVMKEFNQHFGVEE